MFRSDNENVLEFVTARVDGQLFGLPIDRVQDVFAPTRLTRVPLAPPEVAGVLNLRGRIVTVIDMRRGLRFQPRSSTASAMAIGIERDDEAYGLLVDSVGEVMRLPDEARAPSPVNLNPRLAELSAAVFRLDGGLLIALDVDRVLDFDVVTRAA